MEGVSFVSPTSRGAFFSLAKASKGGCVKPMLPARRVSRACENKSGCEDFESKQRKNSHIFILRRILYKPVTLLGVTVYK